MTTHRRLIAAVLASVCRRFFKYLLWYFWSSAMDPLSACILLGEVDSVLLLLMFCCCWMVAIDDSESLEALDESERESGCACCGWLNLILETFIFGDGVNDDDDSLLFDDELLTLDGLLLLLFVLLLTMMPAVKFIRLSFCTFFLTK